LHFLSFLGPSNSTPALSGHVISESAPVSLCPPASTVIRSSGLARPFCSRTGPSLQGVNIFLESKAQADRCPIPPLTLHAASVPIVLHGTSLPETILAGGTFHCEQILFPHSSVLFISLTTTYQKLPSPFLQRVARPVPQDVRPLFTKRVIWSGCRDGRSTPVLI